ncbi:MAG TPA: prephenate dehydrogenase/arogenate dehydrogenase family protein [Caldilineae bacterium]|nr:prephenate dehydrogenase/arogenate dehydrogenase family protein [Caldilineae bacterium]
MSQSQITIIGLGLIGTSLGLALQRNENDFLIVGHDKDRSATSQAKKLGAIDKSDWNLINACDTADLILLAIPAAGIPPTLEIISGDLKPGCLIIDTATIKSPILEAATVLPDNVHFVGGDPVLSASNLTIEDASADLFKDGSWALCPTADTAPDAIRIASDLVISVGAHPFFLDAAEHDGLMAAVDGMPTLLSAAVVQAVSQSPAWREIRRMAGSQFETITQLPGFSPADFATAVQGNRDNIVYWIDAMIEELTEWKYALQGAEEEAIVERFADAIERRDQWLALRAKGEWEVSGSVQETPSLWRQMFGFGGRRSPDKS